MNTKILSFLLLLVLGFTISIYAEGDKKEWKSLSKVTGTPIRTLLNINNVSTVIKNDGISDIDKDEQASGLIFPKGSGKTACYQTGLLWGGRAPNDPQVRVGGTFYSTGLQGGKILNSGLPYDQLQAEDQGAANVRIFRVRPDVYPGGPTVDLSSEINSNEGTAEQIRSQYEADWNEWPATSGAPFEDKNGNGVYDPTVDVPGIPGADQTVWSVGNDLNAGNTRDLYGTQPMGIESQMTYWAYNRSGALGNMFFRKYILINKSNVTYDSVYVSIITDVDLGNASDDFAGCDTTLSLGFTYNANAVDATYNPLPPPAIGFDFFEGPLVKGIAGQDKNKNGVDDAADYGLRYGKKVGPGLINLPMTAFFYFAKGDANVTDPTRSAVAGATEMYNFFQGRIGKTGDFFTTPAELGARPTTFALSGDPMTGQGWVDGMILSSGDRRHGQASGPFTLAPGDTQEVVVAEILAGAIPGVDRLSAVGLLKFYDKSAQDAFDNNFDLPTAPPAPEVNVPGSYDESAKVYYALDKKIVLDWGENPAAVKATEQFNTKGYKFEGYNVYQLPNASASISEGVRVATYDVIDGILKIEGQYFDVTTGVVATKVQQFGGDSGIKRYIEITNDAIKSGIPLVNGIRYYYAVTSYAYNPTATITNLENPLTIFTIIPTSKAPGVSYNSAYADTIKGVVHSKGGSDGNLYPLVIDPSKLTGLSYTVSFDTLLGGSIVWNVDRSDGVRVLSNQTNQNADEESPQADGIQFRVIGAPNDFKLFTTVANANGPIVPPQPGALGAGGFPTPDGGNPTAGVQQATNNSRWFIHTGDNGTRGSYEAFLDRTTRTNALWPLIIPYDFEIRFTATGSKASFAYDNYEITDVPFELWNIGINTPNDPSDDYRMVPWIAGNNDNLIFDISGDHSASGGDNDPYTDWIYWARPANTTPGQAGYLAAEAQMNAGTYDGANETEVMARMVLVNWNGGVDPGPYNANMPETGTIFRIESTKPNVPKVDQFTFLSPKASYSTETAKVEVEKINVFPNPYYGVNSEELNKYNRFVTFTHLPPKVTIRIFNLAGISVATITKDNNSTYQRWNLANDKGLPVASGLYIAYIDMPDLGKTKILKVAIIQEQQILDRY